MDRSMAPSQFPKSATSKNIIGGKKDGPQRETSVDSSDYNNETLRALKTKTLYEKKDTIKPIGSYNALRFDGKRKSNDADDSTGKAEKRRRVSRDEFIEDSIVLEAKRRFRSALMKRIYNYRNKRLRPWYNFASLYASATGGAVHADDLVKMFPYDFYDGDGGSIWTTSSARRGNRFGSSGGDDDDVLNADFLRRMEIEDMEKDLLQEREVTDMMSETIRTLPKTRPRSFSSPSKPTSSMRGSSDLPSQNSFLNSPNLSFSTIGDPRSSTTSTPTRSTIGDPRSSTASTPTRQNDVEKDEPHRPGNGRKDAVLKELHRYKEGLFSKAARMGSMERAFYLDFDDILQVNDLVRHSSSFSDEDEEGENASRDYDTNSHDIVLEDPMVEPTFFSSVKRCAYQINLACGKRFLVKDLVRSEGINSFFASYVALQSTHVNASVPSSKNWSRTSGFGGSGYSSSGNSIYIQPTTTHFAMLANKKELQRAIEFFKNVYKDEESGYLYHISHGPNPYDDEEEDEVDYYHGYRDEGGSQIDRRRNLSRSNESERELSYFDNAVNLSSDSGAINNNWTSFDRRVRGIPFF